VVCTPEGELSRGRPSAGVWLPGNNPQPLGSAANLQPPRGGKESNEPDLLMLHMLKLCKHL